LVLVHNNNLLAYKSPWIDTMKKLLTLAIVLFACHHAGSAALGQKANSSTSLTEEQKGWLAHANRHEKHGWIYLHIEGEPRERGFQHGYLLAGEIRESLRVSNVVWEHHSGMDWPWLVKKAKTVLAPKVDPEDGAEIDGMVEGLRAAGVSSSREELITLNGIIELSDYWWPKEKEKLDKDFKESARDACSAFIATGSATKDGGVVLGHNTMGGFVDADCKTILDIQPANGHRILMQASPGWIHSGTDFFITDAGLVGAETTISGFKGFDAKGIPEFVRMRRAMQDASSLDEWCAIMKKENNGGYANAWLVGDVNTKEIARLELGLKHVGLEKKRDGFFTGSNLAEDLKILRLETDVTYDTDIRRSDAARRVRWKQLMRQFSGQIDLQHAKEFEADHFDTFLGKDRPGYRTMCMHNDTDAETPGAVEPFAPRGTFDAKVVDAAMARRMSFAARWGSACGRAFDAEKFLGAHPQYDWMRGCLKSRASEPWTDFTAGERE
jgi:hypothetical protein